jgi:hypothetical protein
MLPLSPSLWSVPTCHALAIAESFWQGVTKRCHLSWLTNSALVLYDAGEGGGSCGCGVSANEYSCSHGVHINFGDLTPYLTYGFWQFQLLVCMIVNVFNRQSSLNNKAGRGISLVDQSRLSWGGGGHSRNIQLQKENLHVVADPYLFPLDDYGRGKGLFLQTRNLLLKILSSQKREGSRGEPFEPL